MEWMESEPLHILQALPEKSMFPAKISLAMAYVPNQEFENLYDEQTAFAHGTLFGGLDFPFCGEKKKGVRI